MLPQSKRVFDHRGGTLGRAENNTWVLPDPDRFLSSCHCEIICLNQVFFLEDKSTNGTFVNNGLEPIGRGARHQLQDGDFFEIGDYRFSVQLATSAVEPNTSPFDMAPSYSAVTSPFEASPSLDFFGQNGGGVSDLFEQQQDPLALWDKKHSNANASFDDKSFHFADAEANAVLDSFVGLGDVSRDHDFQGMDVSAGIDQSVSWPSAGAESLIPEDWAIDLAKQTSASHLSAAMPKAIASDVLFSPVKLPTSKITALNASLDIPEPSAGASLADLLFGASPVIEQSKPLSSLAAKESFTPTPLIPSNVAPTTAVKIPMPSHHVQATHESSAHSHSSSNILIEALGLDATRLSGRDVDEISRLSGLLMREIVDGMLGVLRSRANIKNEFRMNVTTIQSVENNPLKFSVNVDDALECLFIKKSNAYKKPIEAFREGFQEIAEHQIAMIAGMRQGFDAMMERFDPDQLEKNFNRQSKGSVIPGMQKAKNWNSYTDYYQNLTGNMERSFQHLFGSDFVSAYEDQLRRLLASRKRGELNDDV